MNLGITVFDDRLLIVRHFGKNKSPEYGEYVFRRKLNFNADLDGCAWSFLDVETGDSYRTADKLILSIPPSLCYLKLLEIDSKTARENPDFFTWLAGIHLPGDLSQYQYKYITTGKSFDGAKVKMILTAIPFEPLKKFIRPLKRQNDPREIVAIPEPLGLIKALEKSLGQDDIPQAAIVNCSQNEASAVILKNNLYFDFKYFQFDQGKPDDLVVDIETYLLSRADASEPFPLVVTGSPELFKTNWVPLQPAFLSNDNLKFASAGGAAEHESSIGEQCE